MRAFNKQSQIIFTWSHRVVEQDLNFFSIFIVRLAATQFYMNFFLPKMAAEDSGRDEFTKMKMKQKN